ncbi:hypothetical protein TrVE_jg9822 [Triparma verrucosa]|uniref:Uncharacterized protein n=1 Tax=Triparma verrucosa TaxID=1606542 RepID=A0A9W7C1R7_9STRA|nr:hypothetical protein TrVE_jg9822 [Triparma verrucosa]
MQVYTKKMSGERNDKEKIVFLCNYPTRTALEKGKGNLFIATIAKRKEILNNKLYKPSKIVKSVVKDLPELIAPSASIYQRNCQFVVLSETNV